MCQRGYALLQVHYRQTGLFFFCQNMPLSFKCLVWTHCQRFPRHGGSCVLRQRVPPCAAPRLCTDNPSLLMYRGAVSKRIFTNSLLGKTFEQFVTEALLLVWYSRLSKQCRGIGNNLTHRQIAVRFLMPFLWLIHLYNYLHDLRTCRYN